jgi:hypothetical protein
LTIEQIRAWAIQHFERTGSWPSCGSGAVIGAEGELWRNLDDYLRKGIRGLPGGASLRWIVTALKNQNA